MFQNFLEQGDIYWQKINIIIIIYKNLPYLKYYHIYIIII